MKRYQLIVQKGENSGEIYPLIASTLTIGRDPMCDIIFRDPEVSRQHIRLTRTEWGYQVQELGSTNGTFVDDVRLQGTAVALQHHQQLMLGSNVTLLYEAEDIETSPAMTLAQSNEAWEAQFKPPTSEVEPIHEDEVASTPIFRQQTDEEAPRVIDPDDIDESAPFSADILHQTDRPPLEGALTPTPASEAPARPYQEVSRLTSARDEDEGRKRVNGRSAQHTKEQKQKQVLYWALGCIGLVVFCCCAFFFFMYFVGGDWILQQLGLIP